MSAEHDRSVAELIGKHLGDLEITGMREEVGGDDFGSALVDEYVIRADQPDRWMSVEIVDLSLESVGIGGIVGVVARHELTAR
jgi:hypothetical protein